MKLIHNLKNCVAIVTLNLVLSFFFTSVLDVAYKLWVFGNLKFYNPDIILECWVVSFIVFMLFALVIILLYNVNKMLWDTIDEKREEYRLLKLIPNIKVLASFYLDFSDYLFSKNK